MRRGGCRTGTAECGWNGCRGRRVQGRSRHRSKELTAYLTQVTDPHDGESADGDFLPGARQHRRARGGAAFGRWTVRRADPYRDRSLQLPETPPLPDGRRRPRPPAPGLRRRGAQCPDAAGLLRPPGSGPLRADRAGDGGLGGELPAGGAGAGAEARVVFDRFHVERLATVALDEVRPAEQRGLAPAAAKALKGMRYPLLKHPVAPQTGRGPSSGDASARESGAGPRLRAEGVPGNDPGTHPGGGGAGVAGRVGGLGGPLTSEVLHSGRSDHSEARRGPPRLPGHTNDQRAGRGYQQQAASGRPARDGFHTLAALISMLFPCCGGIELAPPLPTRV